MFRRHVKTKLVTPKKDETGKVRDILLQYRHVDCLEGK